jgi:hypothetical protein
MEENCLQGNPNLVAFIGHDLEAFCKVSIDSLDHHWVMVAAWEKMAVKCFTADPQKMPSLSRRTVWQKWYRNWIFIIPNAEVLDLACWMGSIEANPVMPQHAIRYTSKPSKLECFPAEYASMNKTRKGALIRKFYTSSENLLFVGFTRVQPGQALHICLM